MPKKYKYQESCEEFLSDLRFAGVKDAQIIISTNRYTMMDHGNPGLHAKIVVGPYTHNPSLLSFLFGNPNSEVIYIIVYDDPHDYVVVIGDPGSHLTSIIEQIAKARELRLEFK